MLYTIGTTWMQEIVPLIVNEGDLTPVLTVPNWDRVPWLEEIFAPNLLDDRSSPRAIATHLPYPLMPPTFFTSKAKVIYVMRNPKDVAVSSFHYHGMASFLADPGTFDEFLNKFLSGNVMFGSWFDHVKCWLKVREKDRIMYITYEEMVRDLKGAITKFSNFLGKQLSAETIEGIANHCTFKNMKQNQMSNYSLVPEKIMEQKKSAFLRKGISGDWKNHFTPEQSEHFASVYQEQMKDVDCKFVWDEN
uniref:Sulfotransferase n=1 Tax=Latimeria chalumnae TaxID=7897 RepID=H2ZU87_LATCH|nr:PREDICTED: sulfotransferase family cytosolic 2B member 1-like [Latimeria chalumnae]|eukprot:XP_005999671.2 PREDICTED: sulfotransferase family cytosolic 2B member 1-like [Latimeria chalumnae]